MRVERVPPGDIVVHVGQLGQADPVALAAQHLGHRPVVGQVLLDRTAGQRRRHRLGREGAAAGLADEPGDPRIPAVAALLRVEPAGEERAGLQEQPAEQARVPALGVQCGQPAQAGAHPDHRPGDREPAPDRRQHGQRQRLRVADVRAVPLVPVAGAQQRDPVPGQPPGRGHRRRVRGQGGQRVVLRAVVRDQQRQLLGRPGVRRGPEPDLDLGPQVARGHRQLGHPAGQHRRVQPGRRPVVGELQHRLVPERARRPQRVGRVADLLDAAVRVPQLQPVLHPPDRRPGQGELPGPAVAGEVEPVAGDPDLLGQPDAGQPRVGVREAEGDLGRGHHRAARRGAGPERHRITLGFAPFG